MSTWELHTFPPRVVPSSQVSPLGRTHNHRTGMLKHQVTYMFVRFRKFGHVFWQIGSFSRFIRLLQCSFVQPMCRTWIWSFPMTLLWTFQGGCPLRVWVQEATEFSERLQSCKVLLLVQEGVDTGVTNQRQSQMLKHTHKIMTGILVLDLKDVEPRAQNWTPRCHEIMVRVLLWRHQSSMF